MSNRKRPAPDAPGGSFPDVISDLHSEGHISARGFRAAVLFLSDLRAAHGSSGGLVSQLSDKVQTGARELLWPPGGPVGIAEFDRRVNRLRPHERQLLAFLVKHREHARGTLADLGRQISGYKTAKTMRAVVVGRVGALCDSLAELYPESEG